MRTSCRPLFRLTNLHGALVTMPHKVATTSWWTKSSTTAKIAGACNAILRRPDGSLLGDMFDGEGFVRGVARKGGRIKGASALVVGSGGVGSRDRGLARGGGGRAARPVRRVSRRGRGAGERLQDALSRARGRAGSQDPAGYDIVVNATPLGMKAGDPLPIDVERQSRLRRSSARS